MEKIHFNRPVNKNEKQTNKQTNKQTDKQTWRKPEVMEEYGQSFRNPVIKKNLVSTLLPSFCFQGICLHGSLVKETSSIAKNCLPLKPTK